MGTLKRYMSDSGVRLSIVVTTNVVETARKRHDTWPVATAALGRTMTSAILLAGDYKNKETVSMTIDGNGPLGKIHADALSNNTVRGYVDNPHVDLPLTPAGKLDVGQAVGQGEIYVTRFSQNGQTYSSHCPLASGEIGEDVALYLFMSEQVNSTISVGVLIEPEGQVQVAGGFLVQALPGADPQALAQIEANIEALGPITSYLKTHRQAEDLEKHIMYGVEYEEVFSDTVKFGCTCSKERFLQVLARLHAKERENLLQDPKTELTCHYCNTKYVFTPEELREAFAAMDETVAKADAQADTKTDSDTEKE